MEEDKEPTRHCVNHILLLLDVICPKRGLLDPFYILRKLSLREGTPHAVSHGSMINIQTQVHWPKNQNSWMGDSSEVAKGPERLGQPLGERWKLCPFPHPIPQL